MFQNKKCFLRDKLSRLKHHFFFYLTFILLLASAPLPSFAAYGTCSVKYTSCATGYYMTYNGVYNGTPTSGNLCSSCPSTATYCPGGTAAPIYPVTLNLNTVTSNITNTVIANIYRSASSSSGYYTGTTASSTGTAISSLSSLTMIPKRTGYSFNGYYTAASGGTQVFTSTGAKASYASTFAAQTGSGTLYAQYTPCSYTIAYNSNDGDGTMSSTAATYDSAVNLRSNTFTRSGYRFAGWATSSSGARVYTDGASVTNLTSTCGGTVTLYAKWTPCYAITLNNTGNGGSGGTTTLYKLAGYDGWFSDSACATEITTLPSKPSKSNASYVGHYTAASDGTLFITDAGVLNALTVSGAATLYAQYDCDANYRGSGTRISGTCTSCTKSCDGISGYTSGTYNICTDTSASTCYRACTTSDVANSTAVSGTVTKGGTSTCVATSCVTNSNVYFDGDSCETLSGYTCPGGTSGSDTCYKTCSGNNTSACPSNATCTYDTSYKYYYPNSAGTCPLASFTCNSGYVKNSGGTKCVANTDYSISYNGNGNTGGSAPTSPTTCHYGSACVAPQITYTRTHYNPSYWSCTNCLSGTVDGKSVSSYPRPGDYFSPNGDGNIVLRAMWDAKKYTITLDNNGGSGGDGTFVEKYDASYFLKSNGSTNNYTGKVTVPTKADSAFTGYYTAAVGGDQVIDSAGKILVDTTYFTSDTTIYAQWAGAYTITYDANPPREEFISISGTMADTTCTSGVECGLRSNAFLPSMGYTFGGWNTRRDGSGTAYANRASVTLAGDTTLYAQWTPWTYVLRFNRYPNNTNVTGLPTVDGTEIRWLLDTIECQFGTDCILPDGSNVVYGNYSFVGWKTSTAYGYNFPIIPGGVALDDFGLYLLNITKNNQTVNLYTAFSMYCEPCDAGAGAMCALTITSSFNNNCNYETRCKLGYDDIQNEDAYNPYCIPITYTVRFNSNDGANNTATQTLTYDTPQELTAGALTRTGYDLVGWSLTPNAAVEYADGASVVNLSATAGDTVDLYAHWTPAKYDCDPGYYLNGATCTACQNRHYCTGGTFTYTGGEVGITPCPESNLTDSTGIYTWTPDGVNDDVTACWSHGKYAVDGGTIKVVCAADENGEYGNTACRPNDGTVYNPGYQYYYNYYASNGLDNVLSKTIKPCPANSYCPGGTATSYYNSDAGIACSSLGGGLYKNSLAGSDAASDCYASVPGGKYLAQNTDTTLTDCGVGYYCPAETVYWDNVSSTRTACPDPTTYSDDLAGVLEWATAACPTASATNTEITKVWHRSWSSDKNYASKTDCMVNYFVDTPCATWEKDSVPFDTTTNKYDTVVSGAERGDRYAGTVKPGYYFTKRYSSNYCDIGGYQKLYKNAAVCSAGSYCPGGAPGLCSSGTYNETWGSYICNPGTYQPNTGAASCLSADPGYYVAISGATGQGRCSSGTYQDEAGQTSCKSCPDSVKYAARQTRKWTWSEDGVYRKVADCRIDIAETDPNGNYGMSCSYNPDAGDFGGASDTSCIASGITACSGGYYRNPGVDGNGFIWASTPEKMTETVCIGTDSGYYSPDGNLNQIACPHWNVPDVAYAYSYIYELRGSNAHATSVADCYLDSSVLGYWTHATEHAEGFYYCDGKQYWSDDTGYYSRCTDSKKRFGECLAGYYLNPSTPLNDEFVNSCVGCPAGTYLPYGGSINTGIGGPTAYYHHQTSCTLCPAGTYNPNEKSTTVDACTACPAGSFCVAGVAEPTACATGSYTDTTAQSTCIACGDGENWGLTTTAPGQTSCNATCANKNDDSGDVAVNGWADASWNSNNTVTGLCVPNSCAAHHFMDAGNAACPRCDSVANGLYPFSSRGTTKGSDACYLRLSDIPGEYIADAGDDFATPCPRGTYWDGDSASVVHYGETSTCDGCRGNTYQDEVGQMFCKDCPAGYNTYWGGDDYDGDGNDGDGRTDIRSCRILCPAGTYLANAGDTECTSVGSGYWAAATGAPYIAYGATSTRGQCPAGQTTIGYGVGADEAGDCGRVLNVGNDKIYLRSEKRTTPALNVMVDGITFYGNMTNVETDVYKMSYGAANSLRVRMPDGSEYTVYDDSATVYSGDAGTGITLNPNDTATSVVPATYAAADGLDWTATMADGTVLTGVGACDSGAPSTTTMGTIAETGFEPDGAGTACWCKMTSPGQSTKWVLATSNAGDSCSTKCGYQCTGGFTGVKAKHISFRTNLYNLSGISTE